MEIGALTAHCEREEEASEEWSWHADARWSALDWAIRGDEAHARTEMMIFEVEAVDRKRRAVCGHRVRVRKRLHLVAITLEAKLALCPRPSEQCRRRLVVVYICGANKQSALRKAAWMART